jgi:hypothetical protein
VYDPAEVVPENCPWPKLQNVVTTLPAGSGTVICMAPAVIRVAAWGNHAQQTANDSQGQH